MERKWWCVDCRTPVELTRHGRCATCGSDAVDSMQRSGATKEQASVLSRIPLDELPQYSGVA